MSNPQNSKIFILLLHITSRALFRSKKQGIKKWQMIIQVISAPTPLPVLEKRHTKDTNNHQLYCSTYHRIVLQGLQKVNRQASGESNQSSTFSRVSRQASSCLFFHHNVPVSRGFLHRVLQPDPLTHWAAELWQLIRSSHQGWGFASRQIHKP